jgi:hypothetical protein
MASKWFFYRADERHGPYSSSEIRRLARSGELLHTDLLWREGMRRKRPAGESSNLFPRGQHPNHEAAPARADWETWLDDVQLSPAIGLIGGLVALAALFSWLVIAGLRTDTVGDRPPPVSRPAVGGMDDGTSTGDATLPNDVARHAGHEDADRTREDRDDGSQTANARRPTDMATPSAPTGEPTSRVPDDF